MSAIQKAGLGTSPFPNTISKSYPPHFEHAKAAEGRPFAPPQVRGHELDVLAGKSRFTDGLFPHRTTSVLKRAPALGSLPEGVNALRGPASGCLFRVWTSRIEGFVPSKLGLGVQYSPGLSLLP